MKYSSTRNSNLSYNASATILLGLSKEGGLFLPDNIPTIDLEKCQHMNYEQLAIEILSLYLNDFTLEEIKYCVHEAYKSFDTDEITPVKKVKDDYILELFHGPTSAFKDVALQILPYLISTSLKIQQAPNDIFILTATSGDTGKAALEGFKNVDRVKIMVFYPKDGVSEIQKRQMVTSEGKNVYVVGVDGNFDDCQTMVKECFADEALNEIMKEHHIQFSSANSINVGRLIPQIVYYFKAYYDLVNQKEIQLNEKINISVPTGNFGNILAAYLAKQMGLPIEKFICASNENNVLTDFIQYGIYNVNRPFMKTNSPSMDILVSSNLERYLYLLCKDDEYIRNMMESLKLKGSYQVPQLMHKKIKKEFYASCVNQTKTKEVIAKVYHDTHYLLDPHTAVAYQACQDFKNEKNNDYKTIICATASPYKFMDTVMEALNQPQINEFEMMEQCEKLTGTQIPFNLKTLKEKAILHDCNVSIDDMKKMIQKAVGENHD